VLLGLLAPKCPLCAAAWLSALGVGGTVSGALAAWLRPLLLGTAACALALSLLLALRWARARRQDARAGCAACRAPHGAAMK